MAHFRTIFIPLFIQSLAVTFNDAEQNVLGILQNCNVLLKSKRQYFFEPDYKYPRI